MDGDSAGLSAFNGVEWSRRVSPDVFWSWIQSGHISSDMPVHWPAAHPYPLPAGSFATANGFRSETFPAMLQSGSAFSHQGAVYCRNDGRIGDRCVRCGDLAVTSRVVKLEKQNPLVLCGLFLGVIGLIALSVIFNKKVSLSVGLCQKHASILRKRRIVGFSMAAAAMPIAIIAGTISVNPTPAGEPNLAVFALVLSFMMVAVGLFVQSPRNFSLKLKSVENGVAKLDGLKPEVQRQLATVA